MGKKINIIFACLLFTIAFVNCVFAEPSEFTQEKDVKAGQFFEGLAVIKVNNKYGYIDKTGKVVIEPKYDLASPFNEGYAWVTINNEPFLIDINGQPIKPSNKNNNTKYIYLETFKDGLARVNVNRKYGFVDKNNELIIPAKYDHAEQFFEGLASVKLNNKYGYIDKTGKLIIPLKYDFAGQFYNGEASVRFADRLAIINKQDEIIHSENANKPRVSFDGESLQGFKSGLVKIGMYKEGSIKYGLIDKSGKQIIPAEYEVISERGDESFDCYINGNHKIINKKGELISYHKPEWAEKYNSVNKFTSQTFKIYKDGKSGLADKEGHELVSPEYYRLEPIYPPHEYDYYIKTSNYIILQVEEYDNQHDNFWSNLLKTFSSMFHKESHYKLVDVAKREVHSLPYDSIQFFSQGFYVVSFKTRDRGEYYEHKCGIMNEKGEEILPPKYSYIYELKDGLAQFCLQNENNSSCGFINEYGKIVLPAIYYQVTDFSEDLAGACINGKCGFIDKHGKFVISPAYSDVRNFSDGLAAVSKGYNNWGYINRQGKVVIPFKFESVLDFKNGFAVFHKNFKKGVIDKSGKEIILPKYDNIEKLWNNVALINYRGKQVLINKSGKIILEKENNVHIADIKNNIAVITYSDNYKDKYGLINKHGKFIFDPIYNFIRLDDFKNGLYKVTVDDNCWITDNQGKIILGPEYNIFEFKEGRAQIKLNDKYGLIDEHGQIILEPIYDFITGSNSIFILNNKYGLRNNKIKTPLKYERLEESGDSTYLFIYEDKYGLIDKNGKEIILAKKYDSLFHFRDGRAKICIKGKYGYIDLQGREIIHPEYTGARSFNEGLAAVSINNKWLYIDKSGKIVIKAQYDSALDFCEGMAAVKINNKYRFIDKKGKFVILIKYDSVAEFF